MAIDYKNSLGRYRRYLYSLQNQPLWNASFWLSMTIILVILMVVVFLRPTLITIASLFGQSREQQELISRMDKKLELLKKANENYLAAETKLEFLNQAIPRESRWVDLADELAQTASDSGVFAKEIKVENVVLKGTEMIPTADAKTKAKSAPEEKLPSGVSKVKFSILAEGDYLQFLNLLESIHLSGRITILDNAKINKQKDGVLTLTIEGYAVFFAPSVKEANK